MNSLPIWISGVIVGLCYGNIRKGSEGFNIALISGNDVDGYRCHFKNKNYLSKFKPYIVNGIFYDKLVIMHDIDEPTTDIRTIKPVRVV